MDYADQKIFNGLYGTSFLSQQGNEYKKHVQIISLQAWQFWQQEQQ